MHARTGPGTSEWANLFERRVQRGLELSKRRQVEDKMCASDASSAFGARRQREPKAFTPENGAEPHHRVSNSLLLAILLKADLFYNLHKLLAQPDLCQGGLKERAAFQFIKGKLFLKSTFNHNTPFLIQSP